MSIATLALAAQIIAAQPAAVPPDATEYRPPLPSDAAVPADPVRAPPAPSNADKDGAPVSDPVGATPAAPQATHPQSDIVVTGSVRPPPGDPLQGVNVQTYKVVRSIDQAVTGPVALAYKRSVPSPVRSGLRNALGNLAEPVVALNYLLQLKPGKTAETVGRFAINTTIGAAGLFDIAKKKPFNLPRRTNGFGYTLGYYGVKPGAFLYVPLMGPTTVRDLVGRIADISFLPLAVGSPFSDPAFAIPTTTIRLLDERAEADEAMHKLLDDAPNPYVTVRETYLRTRQAEIDALHGRPKPLDPPPAQEPAPDTSLVEPSIL